MFVAEYGKHRVGFPLVRSYSCVGSIRRWWRRLSFLPVSHVMFLSRSNDLSRAHQSWLFVSLLTFF